MPCMRLRLRGVQTDDRLGEGLAEVPGVQHPSPASNWRRVGCYFLRSGLLFYGLANDQGRPVGVRAEAT